CQLEPHRGLVDLAGESLEICQRALPIAAGFVQVAPDLERPAGAELEGSVGGALGDRERARTLHGPSEADEIFRGEQVERLTVETYQRGHADDVPGVVLDHLAQRLFVARPQEVRITRRHVAAVDVLASLEAE